MIGVLYFNEWLNRIINSELTTLYLPVTIPFTTLLIKHPINTI